VQKHALIAIVGPTASGKTSLGIFLAQKCNGEVISADSRQVYKGLNIGTGKVTKKEAGGIPHHLIDVASPKKEFSANDFIRLGRKAIEKIQAKNRVPMVVGGTGFYVDALLGRIALADVPPNPKLRTQLKKKSVEQLFMMLKKLDPERAKSIDAKNSVRLIRAIEVARAKPGTNPVAEPVDVRGFVPGYSTLWLGINPGKEKLQKNIHDRLLARMKLGMVAEAKRLHKEGLSFKRMEALGLEYRSLARLLQNKITKEEFLVELERAINHYAKRQMTWFKRNKEIHWVKNKSEALKITKEFLSGR
jgi:tRNA dimethylallyltransferase